MTSPMPETMSPREKVARTITYNPVYGKLWEGSDPTKGHIYHLASSGDHAELADTLASPFNACCYREKCQTLIAEVAALRETNTEAERKLAEAVDEERARGQVIINERDKWIVELIRERDEAKAILQDAVSEAVPDAMIFAGHPDARRYSKALDGLRIWTARARTFLSKEAERG